MPRSKFREQEKLEVIRRETAAFEKRQMRAAVAQLRSLPPAPEREAPRPEPEGWMT